MSPIACTHDCVSQHPDLGHLQVPRQDPLAFWYPPAFGQLQVQLSLGRWLLMTHTAGVRGAHREPCLRERSHLRNEVIFAITEGFDKYIPRVSAIFYDTAHTLEAQWQGHIEKQSGVPSAHRCQAHPLRPAS